jgi:signal transduction histidine kinase/CheY-like chemotaxis protein
VTPTSTSRGNVVLILAPRGRDAAVITQVLSSLHVTVSICADLKALARGLGDQATAAVVTEETLGDEGAGLLEEWVGGQPSWSDFPFVVLATKQSGRRSPQAAARLAKLGNEVLLERPLNVDTLVSAVNSALRSRQRQFEARRQLQQYEAIGLENQRLYEAEREALADAEAANRAKDEFLATLSHELRTPLSAILGWTYVLQQRRAELGDLARGIDTIERNARSQARLIEDLLDMSRIVAGKIGLELQTVVPAQLIEQVVASLAPAAQAKGLTIATSLAPAMTPTAADAQRFLQVFRNLVTNAIKFTPEGGTVNIHADTAGEVMTFTVSDDGIGIAAEFLPHVFERFRQADSSTTRRQAGLGLGLAIVKRLVELHGGTVEARSPGRGAGASFIVRLPMAPTQSPQAVPADPPDAAPRAAEHPLQDVKVLLVEDDPDGRAVVDQLLRDSGARVVPVDSAATALDALRGGLFDIVLSDIGMPDVDGIELLKRIRHSGNPIPAVALTAFARPEDVHRVIDSGYAAHLSKPVEPPALLAAIAEVVRRGR